MAKKPSYSFSKLETDEKCPFAYQKIYIERIPRAETEPLVIGKMLHELAAQYLDRLIGSKLQTDWAWAEQLTPKEAPDDVFEIWPRFFNSFILPPMESPGVELKLAFDRRWKPTDISATMSSSAWWWIGPTGRVSWSWCKIGNLTA